MYVLNYKMSHYFRFYFGVLFCVLVTLQFDAFVAIFTPPLYILYIVYIYTYIIIIAGRQFVDESLTVK